MPNQQTSRWLCLAVLCTGVLMIVLDQTIVNVALPSIQADLGFSQAGLAWVVNAYLIAFGGILLLAGRLGDLLGRRTVFLAGLAVFTGASAVCGLSGSQAMLVGARFVQGVGGATTMAPVLGMIVTMFDDAAGKAKAIGVYSFVASAGASIGLLMGGVLTQALNWHWIFFVNLPIGLAVGLLTVRLLEPEKGLGMAAGADGLGAALVTASLMLGVYAIVDSPELGSAGAAALGLAAVALMAGFLVRQAVAEKPLMPLTIFRSRSISAANAVEALTVAAMIGMFFLCSLYLERVLNFSPLELGISFLPASLSISALSLWLAPRLNVRFGERNVLLAGLAISLVGLVLISRAPAAGRYLTDVLPAMLLVGVGIGVMFPALMTLAMAGVGPEDAGLASGLINTSGQVGGALGLAALATLAAGRTQGLLSAGAGSAEALTAGYDLAFVGCAILFVAAIAIALTMLRSTCEAPEMCPEIPAAA
ncbi:MAG TPA: MFS transporter [Chloroflexota bacterium]|nr:MFS transporter [Chloroflexota bacterium]